ncbi:hypothetical protein BaRGS_00025917 [Batillaria attramentaria]|uniref:Uncharacterized protein n=1 Tax=Batillaria attramentaria TaxID=370345 RepID=A0ABD0K6M9_9CAEN
MSRDTGSSKSLFVDPVILQCTGGGFNDPHVISVASRWHVFPLNQGKVYKKQGHAEDTGSSPLGSALNRPPHFGGKNLVFLECQSPDDFHHGNCRSKSHEASA